MKQRELQTLVVADMAHNITPFNNFKKLEACATKVNGDFKRLKSKDYGNKYCGGPFKSGDDGKVLMPLEMSFGSLYEFAKKGHGDTTLKFPTPVTAV